MTLTVLVVDDESWARRRLTALLRDEQDVELLGECAGGAEAVQAILERTPDLVFLDVQMPDFDGFEVLQAIAPGQMPLVIFATAYDEYAIRAFDAHALDYLVKPFDEDRFHRAIGRARDEIEKRRMARIGRLEALTRSLGNEGHFLRRIAVKHHGSVRILRATEVDWFEAADNYVTLHVAGSEYLIRDTVNSLEGKLDPEEFVRVHRAVIVNLDRVLELSAWFHGEQVLTLKDGTRLTVGRAFRGRLQRLLTNMPR